MRTLPNRAERSSEGRPADSVLYEHLGRDTNMDGLLEAGRKIHSTGDAWDGGEAAEVTRGLWVVGRISGEPS